MKNLDYCNMRVCSSAFSTEVLMVHGVKFPKNFFLPSTTLQCKRNINTFKCFIGKNILSFHSCFHNSKVKTNQANILIKYTLVHKMLKEGSQKTHPNPLEICSKMFMC